MRVTIGNWRQTESYPNIIGGVFAVMTTPMTQDETFFTAIYTVNPSIIIDPCIV